MKVYIILQDFREDYEDAGVFKVYANKSMAEEELSVWERENEDNSEEIRYLIESEVQE